jgi:SAM-dependent methyltransferase
MSELTHRTTCRLCESDRLELVLPIRASAIGDAFTSQDKLDEPSKTYPLDTYLCLDCGHLQNIHIVNPDILFRNYTYRSSDSLGLVKHFQDYAKSVTAGLGLPQGSLIIEMGSNDGSLLKAFKAEGMRVLGIDPARNIAAAATAEGVPTLPEFFTSEIAAQILADNGPAALMCANNVFAHMDGLPDVVRGIRTVLAPNGAFVFEVSYIVDMIDNMVFDTIYHEHVSHHALEPLEGLFNRFDMTLFDAVRVPTKGGSIRAFAQPKSTGQRPRSASLIEMMEEEKRRGITQPGIYRQWYQKIEERRQETLDYIDAQIAAGKTIAGYGASTTATTLTYHFELGSRMQYIFDDNPIKHGLYSPGFHLPVRPSSEIYKLKPDVIVILVWTYADVIAGRHAKYLEEGGKFLSPLPGLRIIEAPQPPEPAQESA